MPEMTMSEIREQIVKSALDARKGETHEEKVALFDAATKSLPYKSIEAQKKVGAFFKALVTNNTEVLKDLSSGVDANGGFLTPLEFSGMLMERLYKLPVIRAQATAIPMNSDKMEVPTEVTTVATNWTSELGTVTQSDPTFGEIVLAANNLIGISRMSRQILLDADIKTSLVDWIVNRFAMAIGRQEDTAFMTGSGTGQPKGIRQYTFTQTYAQAGASLAYTDLVNIFYGLPIQYRRNAFWLMNDKIAGVIRKLTDSNGQPLWVTQFGVGLTQDGLQESLFGRPVLIQNDIPTNLGGGTNASEIYFGDLSYYVIGDREQVFSEISTQEGTSFAQHRAAVKVGERIDGQLSITESFVQATGVK